MFKIHTDTSTLAHSKNDVTTGSLYIELNERFFPEEGWSDFAIIICNWWMENNLRLIEDGVELTYRFMDGPHYFVLWGQGENLHIKLIDHDEVIDYGRADKQTVIDQVAHLRTTLLDACNKNGWNSKEIQKLEAYD